MQGSTNWNSSPQSGWLPGRRCPRSTFPGVDVVRAGGDVAAGTQIRRAILIVNPGSQAGSAGAARADGLCERRCRRVSTQHGSMPRLSRLDLPRRPGALHKTAGFCRRLDQRGEGSVGGSIGGGAKRAANQRRRCWGYKTAAKWREREDARQLAKVSTWDRRIQRPPENLPTRIVGSGSGSAGMIRPGGRCCFQTGCARPQVAMGPEGIRGQGCLLRCSDSPPAAHPLESSESRRTTAQQPGRQLQFPELFTPAYCPRLLQNLECGAGLVSAWGATKADF